MEKGGIVTGVRAFLRMICLAVLALAAVHSGAQARTVSDIRVGDNEGITRFVVEADQPLKYSLFTLADPHRVVIDISEAQFASSYAAKGGGLIARYRFGLFEPGTSRIVLDLSGPATVHKHFALPPAGKTGHRLVVDLKPTSRENFLANARSARDMPQTTTESAPPIDRSEPRPEQVRRLIVIDAGHGGVDPGAISVTGMQEKVITLSAAKVIKEVLEKTGRYEVMLTRDRDIFLPLRQRFEIARRARADLFISLHADSFKTSDVRGASVYTLSERASDREAALLAAKENKADIIAGIDLQGEAPEVSSILIDLARRETMNYSAHFATLLVQELGEAVMLRRNTHRFAGFMVLKAPDVPSVLLEMGYLSNPQDAKALATRASQEKIGHAIRRAVDNYFLKVASHQQSML